MTAFSEAETKAAQASSTLYQAACTNDLSAVKEAIAAGADVNVADLQGVTPLLIAIKNKNQAVRILVVAFSTAQLIQALISAKANVNLCSNDSSPLHQAIRNKDVALAEQLLNAGGNVNLQADYGKTLLHTAIQEGQWEIVDNLLKRR